MKKQVISAFLLSAMTFCPAIVFSQENTNVQSQTLQGSVTVIPVGTNFSAVTTSELSSSSMTIGSGVSVMLSGDFYYAGKLIAPSGSIVNGSVVQLRKAGFAGKNGNFKIRFTTIVTPSGQTIAISGMLKTEKGDGVVYGGTAKDTTLAYTKDVAIGAGAGALAGVIISPMSGGSVGRGTALGTAVGAGGGLVKSFVDKGVDACLDANSLIQIVLDQPMTYTNANRY